MRLWASPMPVRGGVALFAALWLLGVGLLLLAWRSDVQDRRQRAAGQCPAGQEFSGRLCRAELDGRISNLTESHVWVDVDGHHLSMSTTFSLGVPEVEGRAVRVTLLRGRPVRVEGDHLSVGSSDTPGSDRATLLGTGLLCLAAGGTVLTRALLHGRRVSAPE